MFLENTDMELAQKGEPKPTIISLVKYPTNKLPIANKASGKPVARFASCACAIYRLKELFLLRKVRNNKRYE